MAEYKKYTFQFPEKRVEVHGSIQRRVNDLDLLNLNIQLQQLIRSAHNINEYVQYIIADIEEQDQ